MEIKLLSPFFFPEKISTGKYNTMLADRLSMLGFQVQVITMYPFYPEWEIKTKIDDEWPLGLVFRSGKYIKFPRNAMIRRFILEFYYFWIVLKKSNIFTREGIIISVYPPSLFGILFLRKKNRKVGIIHDLQSIYAKEKKGIGYRIINYAIQNIEKIIFRRNDINIVLSNEIGSYLKDVYQINPDRIVLAYPFKTIETHQASFEGDLKQIFSSNRLSLVYSGALGDKQNPEVLFNIMNQIITSYENIEFLVFSSGPVFEKLKRIYPSIIFNDLVEETDLPSLYWNSDIQIISQKPGTSGGSMPSKLPNIVASGTPIFLISDEKSEVSRFINENDLGVAITQWTFDAFLGAIENIKTKYININKSIRIQKNTKIVNTYFNIDSIINIITGGNK